VYVPSAKHNAAGKTDIGKERNLRRGMTEETISKAKCVDWTVMASFWVVSFGKGYRDIFVYFVHVTLFNFTFFFFFQNPFSK
jgi:hypothetical protein